MSIDEFVTSALAWFVSTGHDTDILEGLSDSHREEIITDLYLVSLIESL